MPSVKIFQTLRDKVKENNAMLPMERRAWFWFNDYAKQLFSWQQTYVDYPYDKLKRAEFTKQLVGSRQAQPGFMYFFLYDPKWKKELPYYDTFPYTLVLSVDKDSFLGLNFHYLGYGDRARFFDALYPFREGRASRPNVRDIRMRLRVTYAILKMSQRYAPYKPCLKKYLMSHIKSPLLKVGAKEWDISIFLPVESFVKQSPSYVWRQSRKHF